MTNFIAEGWFNTANPEDSIVVNADFNGWQSHGKMMPVIGDPDIYEYATDITMVAGDTIYWKFRAFPEENWINRGWELGNNRELEFTGEELVFRLWDASAAAECSPPFNINYVAGNGTYAQISLMEFRVFCSITLDLVDSWNLISTLVMRSEFTLKAVYAWEVLS